MFNKEQKNLGIQYLRGLAALAVVFCHYGDLNKYPNLTAMLSYGQIGVHVFFLISGFVIIYSLIRSKYRVSQFFYFLLKRTIRIDPSYIAVIILHLLLFTLLAYIPSFKGQAVPFIPYQFLAHVLYIVPFTKYGFYYHIFWTLGIEFQFYLFIGLLYFVVDKSIYRTIFIILFSLTCFIPFHNSFYILFTYAPIFALGMALVSFTKNKTWDNGLFCALISGLIAYKFGVIIFSTTIICSLIICTPFKFDIKGLNILGKISYSLYLTHPIVSIVFNGVVKRINPRLADHQLIWLPTQVMVAIAFAYLFYLLLERPTLKLSKRFSYHTNG